MAAGAGDGSRNLSWLEVGHICALVKLGNKDALVMWKQWKQDYPETGTNYEPDTEDLNGDGSEEGRPGFAED
jgi:hypothetical protein